MEAVLGFLFLIICICLITLLFPGIFLVVGVAFVFLGKDRLSERWAQVFVVLGAILIGIDVFSFFYIHKQ